MSFLEIRKKFKLLQNSPVVSPSPLARPGLSHSTVRVRERESWNAASERYIDLAEVGRFRPTDHQSRSSDLAGGVLENLRARKARSCLALPY